MKTVGVLSFILLAIAMASADDYANSASRSENLEVTGASAIPQPATNPANVIFRTIQAPSTIARSREYVLQPAARPVSFFSQPVVTRVVQQAVQPVITRTVVQPVVQPVVTRTVLQPAIQQVAVKAEEPEPIDPNPSYNFGYEINNAENTVHTGHKESRSNGEVTGEYRVLDPNGNLRITRYTAGPNGYNAEVEIQEGAGPVYQHVVRKDVEGPATTIVTKPVITLPAPVAASSEEDTAEKNKQSVAGATVLSLNQQQQGTFFQAPSSAGVQYAYIAVPQQSQAVRFLSSGSQVLANPYSYIRTVAAPAPITVRKEYSAPAATAFSSGTSFTKIVHPDGTTVEY